MIITRWHYIIGAVLLLLAFQWLRNDTPEKATDVSSTADRVEIVDWSLQKDVELEATQARKIELLQLEEVQTKRSASARELPNYRQRILSARQAEWTAFLDKHWEEYQRLIEVAKLNENGKTFCTICEGDTYLDFCIFCNEPSNGVCVTCQGEGLHFGNELCPSCQGSGRCFMCTKDLHQMMCPFCDDGDIDIDYSEPSLYPTER